MQRRSQKPSGKGSSKPAEEVRHTGRTRHAGRRAALAPSRPQECTRPDHWSAEERAAMDRALRAYEVMDLSRALDREVRKLLLAAERRASRRRVWGSRKRSRCGHR